MGIRRTETGAAVSSAVVCGIDASAEALAAGRIARELADRTGLPVVFVHVLEGRGTSFEVAVARGLLAAAIDSALPRRGAVPLIEIGEAHDRLVDVARRHHATALVIGRSADGGMGATPVADLAKRAECPVLLVSADGRVETSGAARRRGKAREPLPAPAEVG